MNSPTKNTYTFQTEVEKLLGLLAHSLYSNPEIFLRELISNASDALTKLKFLSQTDSNLIAIDEKLQIKITIDEKEKSFSIEDNGLGMSSEDLVQNIGTIAGSGTLAYLHENSTKENLNDLIGKFGVGFYSVFMVADRVQVETKKYNEAQSFVWESDGKGTFTIEPGTRGDRGTKISFHFNPEMESFANKWKLESVIHQYSDFVPYPISINDILLEHKPALWSLPKKDITDKEYKELYQYLSLRQGEYLLHYHYHSDAPQQFQAVIFVPENRDRSMFQVEKDIQVQLYSRKIFIQNDCKSLLPTWLRFLVGVVDSQDLPLNVSRQTVQESPVLAKIQNFLTKRLLSEWKKLQTQDSAKFEKFYKLFGIFLKEGLHTDLVFKEELTELYHAETSKSDGKLKTLQQYVDDMLPGQEQIFYVAGANASNIKAMPNMEAFLSKGIEVLYLYEEVDDFILSGLHSYKDKKLINIDRTGIDLNFASSAKENTDKETPDKTTDETKTELEFEQSKFLNYMKDVLQDQVEEVRASNRLVSSPCTLLAKKDAPSAHMERMLKMMQSDFSASKRVLEVNLKHKLLVSMQRVHQKRPQDPELKEAIQQLLDSCLLLENNLSNPLEAVNRFNHRLEKFFELYKTDT